MPIVPTTPSKLRPILTGMGRLATSGRLANPTLNVARRGAGVLSAKTDKHLMSEFVAVRGPVADEVNYMTASEEQPNDLARLQCRQI